MKGLNKVQLIGNLGADPDCKTTATGNTIANLNVATNERRKDTNGNWTEHTEWHKVVAFGKLADVCKDYLSKGSKIYVEGRLQTNSWLDKNDSKHYTTEIVANELLMLDGKSTQQSTTNTGNDDMPF